MEVSHKKHRPHIRLGKDAEKEGTFGFQEYGMTNDCSFECVFPSPTSPNVKTAYLYVNNAGQFMYLF